VTWNSSFAFPSGILGSQVNGRVESIGRVEKLILKKKRMNDHQNIFLDPDKLDGESYSGFALPRQYTHHRSPIQTGCAIFEEINNIYFFQAGTITNPTI